VGFRSKDVNIRSSRETHYSLGWTRDRKTAKQKWCSKCKLQKAPSGLAQLPQGIIPK
jgi:hypothetical protein